MSFFLCFYLFIVFCLSIHLHILYVSLFLSISYLSLLSSPSFIRLSIGLLLLSVSLFYLSLYLSLYLSPSFICLSICLLLLSLSLFYLSLYPSPYSISLCFSLTRSWCLVHLNSLATSARGRLSVSAHASLGPTIAVTDRTAYRLLSVAVSRER